MKVSALASTSKDQRQIAAMYNNRQGQGVRGRKMSKIYALRKLNNWVKSILLRDHIGMKGATVLDFCGGKGGDVGKYSKQGIREYVLADHAYESVAEAQSRYNSMRQKDRRGNFNFPCHWYVGDLFRVRLSEALDGNMWFDLVSCQFAFHYGFETERRLRAGLTNVTDRLKPGAFFVGTTLDSNVLIKKWRHEPKGKHDFGNNAYRVRFCTDSKAITDIEHKTLNPSQPFGIRYFFNLDDAVDECPEYIVHFPTFKRIAAEYGLELVMEQNFHEFFVRNYEKPSNMKLLHGMGVLGERGQFPQEQWDIAYLYKAFVFRKTTHGGDGNLPRRVDIPAVRTYKPEHIVQLSSGGASPAKEEQFAEDDEDYDISVT